MYRRHGALIGFGFCMDIDHSERESCCNSALFVFCFLDADGELTAFFEKHAGGPGRFCSVFHPCDADC